MIVLFIGRVVGVQVRAGESQPAVQVGDSRDAKTTSIIPAIPSPLVVKPLPALPSSPSPMRALSEGKSRNAVIKNDANTHHVIQLAEELEPQGRFEDRFRHTCGRTRVNDVGQCSGKALKFLCSSRNCDSWIRVSMFPSWYPPATSEES